jgi:PIN domain nuclease of toxin-antitoxin system
MRLLLDTHIVYWAFYSPDQLSRQAASILMNADEVFVSAASIWEMAIKVRIGKMKGDPREIAANIANAHFQELPVWSSHAVAVSSLPLHHQDPFDRLLIAQAITESLHLLTVDTQLKPCTDRVLCV